MKTSSMVWIIVVVLVVLAVGWYVWSQSSSGALSQSQTTQIADTGTTPVSDTQVLSNPTGVQVPTGSSATATATSSSISPPPVTPPSSGSAPMSATVAFNGTTFTPATVIVAKGGTVTFTDNSGTMWLASDPHPVHTNYDGTTESQHCAPGYTGAAPFDQCSAGSSFTFTFNKVGSWGYHDHMSPSSQGTVVVK